MRDIGVNVSLFYTDFTVSILTKEDCVNWIQDVIRKINSNIALFSFVLFHLSSSGVILLHRYFNRVVNSKLLYSYLISIFSYCNAISIIRSLFLSCCCLVTRYIVYVIPMYVFLVFSCSLSQPTDQNQITTNRFKFISTYGFNSHVYICCSWLALLWYRWWNRFTHYFIPVMLHFTVCKQWFLPHHRCTKSIVITRNKSVKLQSHHFDKFLLGFWEIQSVIINNSWVIRDVTIYCVKLKFLMTP